MKEELGTEWQMPNLFRIGASSLLTDIERQLEYFVTGDTRRRTATPCHDPNEGFRNRATYRGKALKKNRIRVLSLGIFRRGDSIFVAEGFDPDQG